MSASMKFCEFVRNIPKCTQQNGCKEIPAERSGHRIVVTDGDLFAVGGYNPKFWDEQNDPGITNYPLFRELWQFNFASRKWRKLDAIDGMPFTLASHSVVLCGNHIVMFGGTSVPFGETSSNDVDVCNLKSLEWRHLTTNGDLPIPSYGVGMCTIDNHLYVCGGTTGWHYNIDVHRLDLTTLEWQYLEAQRTEKAAHFAPPQRYRHEVATDGERIYVFGGGRSTVVYSFSDIHAFHIEEQVWEKINTKEDPRHGYPLARRCHGCAQWQDDVYICGGYNGTDIYGDLWTINLKELCWRKYDTTMPQPSYFLDAAMSPHGRMYIFGGVTVLDKERTSEIYSIQLKIPSLREMGWYTIVNTVPHIETVARTALVELGIPRDLIQRVQFDDDAVPAAGV